jgi:hypothetical protein
VSRKTNWYGAAFTLLVSAFLIFKLTGLGWGRVWSSVPVSPLFYLVLIAKFLVPPVAQALAFGRIWKLPLSRAWPVALIKRTLDRNLLDLSGDVYLFAWSRRNIAIPTKDVLLAIKDNLLMSTAASAASSILVLAAFLAAGVIVLSPGRPASLGWRAILAAAAIVLVVALAYRFRKKILFLEPPILARVFTLHFGRGLLVQALQVVQWAAAMPSVPLSKWFQLLAAQIVIGFIPLMPSRNLVFFGAGLELAGRLRIDTPDLAGMLLAANVVVQGLNLGLFLWASFAVKRMERAGGPNGTARRVNDIDADRRGPSTDAGSPTETGGLGRKDPSS